MDNRKIIASATFVVLLCLMSVSCKYFRGTKNLAENDSVSISKTQMDSINQSRDLFAGLSKDMQEELYRILWDMDKIAGETFELERQREREGSIKEKTAVRIQKRIASVKEQIEAVEAQAESSPQLRSMLRQLRSSLLDKDEEVERLKAKLQRKKSTLQAKYDELALVKNDLELIISNLKMESANLEKLERDLYDSKTTSWSKVGDKLMQSLDYIEITKKRGKGKEVRAAKMQIAQRAVWCFEKAKVEGDVTAEGKIKKLNMIIQQLNNGDVN